MSLRFPELKRYLNPTQPKQNRKFSLIPVMVLPPTQNVQALNLRVAFITLFPSHSSSNTLIRMVSSPPKYTLDLTVSFSLSSEPQL